LPAHWGCQFFVSYLQTLWIPVQLQEKTFSSGRQGKNSHNFMCCLKTGFGDRIISRG